MLRRSLEFLLQRLGAFAVDAKAQLAGDDGASADAVLAQLGDHTQNDAVPALLHDLRDDVGVERELLDYRSAASIGSSWTGSI